MNNLKHGIAFFTFNNVNEIHFVSNEFINYLDSQGKHKNSQTNKVYCSKDIIVTFS